MSTNITIYHQPTSHHHYHYYPHHHKHHYYTSFAIITINASTTLIHAHTHSHHSHYHHSSHHHPFPPTPASPLPLTHSGNNTDYLIAYYHSYTPLTTTPLNPLTTPTTPPHTQAMALTAELGALVKTESVRHLQTIHDVCEIAATLQQGVYVLCYTALNCGVQHCSLSPQLSSLAVAMISFDGLHFSSFPVSLFFSSLHNYLLLSLFADVIINVHCNYFILNHYPPFHHTSSHFFSSFFT